MNSTKMFKLQMNKTLTKGYERKLEEMEMEMLLLSGKT